MLVQDNMERNYYVYIVIFWVPFAILAIFIDLNLSINVVNSQSIIGLSTAKYGEVPGYYLILVSLSILGIIELETKRNFYRFYILVALSILPAYLISSKYINNFTLKVVLTLIHVIIPFILIRRYRSKLNIEIRQAATKTIYFTIFVPIILVLGIKTIWGRVRFRDLNNDFTNFTAWYIPNGINGNRSFPSGHAALAWLTVCLVFFVPSKWKKSTFIVTIVWTIIVSIGRILIGAHYLSDVIFSGIFSSIILLYLSQNHPEGD